MWSVLLVFQMTNGDLRAHWHCGDNVNSKSYNLASTQHVPGSFHRLAPWTPTGPWDVSSHPTQEEIESQGDDVTGPESHSTGCHLTKSKCQRQMFLVAHSIANEWAATMCWALSEAGKIHRWTRQTHSEGSLSCVHSPAPTCPQHPAQSLAQSTTNANAAE